MLMSDGGTEEQKEHKTVDGLLICNEEEVTGSGFDDVVVFVLGISSRENGPVIRVMPNTFCNARGLVISQVSVYSYRVRELSVSLGLQNYQTGNRSD